jgi:hypothetical protein
MNAEVIAVASNQAWATANPAVAMPSATEAPMATDVARA